MTRAEVMNMITGLSDILPGVASAFSRLFAKVAGLSATEHNIKPRLPAPPEPPSLEEMEYLFAKTRLKDSIHGSSYNCYWGTKIMADYIEQAPYAAWSKTEENYRFAASRAVQQILGDSFTAPDGEGTRRPNVTHLLDAYSLRQHILKVADDFRSSYTSRPRLLLVTRDFNNREALPSRLKAAILTEFVENLSALVEKKYPDLLPEEKIPEKALVQHNCKVINLH